MPKSRHTEIIACSMPKSMLALIDDYASLDRHAGNRSAAMRELVVLGLREVERAKQQGKQVKPVVINFKTGYVTLVNPSHAHVPEVQEIPAEELEMNRRIRDYRRKTSAYSDQPSESL